MKTYPIDDVRHLVLRATSGEMLPDALVRALSDNGVSAGWMRASGVLSDVRLRALDGALAGEPRRIAGPVQALSIEGGLGLERGEPSVALRAVLGRETDRGMEVLAGEIVSARVVALEAYVTAFDGVAIGRALDPSAHVTLFADAAAPARAPGAEAARPPAAEPARAPAPLPSEPTAKPVAAAWSDAVAASVEADRPPARAGVIGGSVGGAIPARLAVRQTAQEDTLVPEPGDLVEHFAFGRADVVKSDGDRLHLRGHKDQRIREIALEMLKVTPLPPEGETRRFKLERKL